ncbi:MAG: GMC family oxidoreductase [Deltaproteobacteria bacterium]|nr:GMC family oxidoreductase [Deltaproteobacteria bacterium]
MIFTHKQITKNIDETCDVCVVGSGAGGAVVAKELAEAGLSVIVLEEGGYYDLPDFRKNDTVSSIVNLYRDAGSTVLMGKPNVLYTEGRCVGGSTTINGGICWRTPDKILKRWQWEKGLSDLTPKRMDFFFKRVEEIISVKPILPEARNEDAEILKRGAEKLGYKVRANLRAHRACVGTNQCVTGCPTGAKQPMLVTYIPAMLKAGGRLYANCRVKKIKTKRGRATGVVGEIIDPETKKSKAKVRIRSRITVICGGAVQTPSLLMRSHIPDTSGRLGQNLLAHPNTKVIGVFDDAVYGWKGVNQAYQVTEFMDEGILMGVNFVPPGIMTLALPFYGEGFLQAVRGIFNHCVLGAALIEDTSRGRVVNLPFDQSLALYQLNARDFEHALRATALLAEIYFAAGASRVFLPFSNLHEIETIDDLHKIYEYPIRPSDLELMTVHVMGTCQMGADPKKSVINPFGESHHIRGLYVADASIFPTSIGVNPQESIMAFATRTAFHIAENQAQYVR